MVPWEAGPLPVGGSTQAHRKAWQVLHLHLHLNLHLNLHQNLHQNLQQNLHLNLHLNLSYLVRESDRKPGSYVLSYFGKTGINHFR